MKSTSKNAATKSPKAPTLISMPVALRVKAAHIEALDKIASNMGIIRSAAIQIAIAEFIERRGK
jgi:predicted transcriptional regulator